MNYELINKLRIENNLSKNELARIVDMSGTGFNQMIMNQSMTVSTLEKLAVHFNVPIFRFFDDYSGDNSTEKDEKDILDNEKDYGCKDPACKAQIDALNKALDAKEELLEMYRENAKKESSVENSAQIRQAAKR